MCLLLLMPDTVTADLAKLKIAAENNPDGFGFAISTGTKIITGQHMDFDVLANQFLEQRAIHTGPAIFHLRIATHGALNTDNCHPFFLGKDPDTVMAHNGILSITQHATDRRSDSKAFAEDIMPTMGGVASLDDDEEFKKLSKWATGSKIAFLTVNPDADYDWYIVNEKDGHWGEDQVWWSNNSYKFSPPAWSGKSYGSSAYLGTYGGSYGGSWRGSDDNYWSKENAQGIYVPSVTSEDYDDEDGMGAISAITSHGNLFHFATEIDEDCYSVDCFKCGQAEVVDDLGLTYHTHCTSCHACMSCGRTAKQATCDCWDEWMEEMW